MTLPKTILHGSGIIVYLWLGMRISFYGQLFQVFLKTREVVISIFANFNLSGTIPLLIDLFINMHNGIAISC